MDIIATKRDVSYIFKLLAICLDTPDPSFLTEKKICLHLFQLFNDICPEACVCAEKMQNSLQKYSKEELQIAYTELFVGPFKVKASPYGATYLEKERKIMGDTTMGVLQYYRRAHLEVDSNEPPDHITIELDFLSHLYALEAEALHNKDDKKIIEIRDEQRLFLGKYLQPWIPDFIDNIRHGTQNKFYLNLADCLELFLLQTVPALR